ncbi:MAG: hypothetical protein ACRYFB_13950 [Janthinobacterium lividum]
MATTSNKYTEEEMPTTVTGEPTDQLSPEDDDLEEDDLAMDDAGIDDDEEPYEGIHHGDEDDEDMVDDNMTGMPVVPSPS